MAKGTGAAQVKTEAAGRATFDMLMSKKPKRIEFNAALGPDGSSASFLFQSIDWREYDALLTANPPTAEQRVTGGTYNPDTFAPALLARVCVEPAIDEDGWKQVLATGNWGRGEVSALFFRAMDLCTTDISVTPIVAG